MADTRKISYGSPYKQPSLDDMRRYVAEREQRAREAAWLAANPRADINPVEQPFLDPVDTMTGGIMALPRGLGNALADMAIDTGIGFAMDYGMGDAAPAMFIGKKGIQKLGMNAERDLFGQFSGLWDKGVRAEIDNPPTFHMAPTDNARLAELSPVPVGVNAYDDLGDVRAFSIGDNPMEARYIAQGNERIEMPRFAVDGGYQQKPDLMAHELQHAIQEREGFARGGSPDTMSVDLQMQRARAERRAAELRETPAYKEWIARRDSKLNDPNASIDEVNEAFAAAQRNRPPEVVEYQDLIGNVLQNKQTGLDAYRRLAGEWEARNAGTRAVLPSNDPRLGNALATPSATFRTGNPFSTADDIPLDDLIVRMDGGEALSYNPSMDTNGDVARLFLPPTLKKFGHKEGDPVTMWHGSSGGLRGGKFDLGMVGRQRGTTEGWGSYWSTDRDNALRFGKSLDSINVAPEDIDSFIDFSSKLKDQTPYVAENVQKMLRGDYDNIPKNLWQLIRRLSKNPFLASKYDLSVDDLRKISKKTPDEIVSSLSETSGGRMILSEVAPPTGDNTGGQLYQYLSNLHSGYDKRASEQLWDYGIPGAIFNSSADLHSVNFSPNALIWAKEIL